QYALRQISAATHERNRLKFERYVDVGRFSAATIDEITAQVTLASVNDATTGFGVLGTVLGTEAMDKLKPALTSELRSTVLDAVGSGRFDSLFSRTPSAADSDLTLAVVARNVSADQVRFAGLGPLHREGDVATVDLRLRNQRFDTTLVLRVRMERSGKRWRVVAPDNLSEYLTAVDDLQKRTLATVNQERRARIAAAASIGPVRRTVRSDGLYNSYVFFTARVRNTGRDTITTLAMMLWVDGDSIPFTSLPFGTNQPIAPGRSRRAETFIDYNQYIDWHTRVRYGSHLRAKPFLVVTRRGPVRDTLFEYASWKDYAAR
ncbi:MAG TPA: hypothetical protein VFW98_08555, partial [Gemmatimonadaceae bacterium]|nr:hypothetical protein [Gemmatimonadaceae bacterium]